MRKLITLAALILYASLTYSQDPIVINVGLCAHTPSGDIDSRFCDTGDDGTAPTFEWSQIPNVHNSIEGTPLADDFTTYLTDPGTPSATITIVNCTLSNGWSFVEPDLIYSGTGVYQAVCNAQAEREGVIITSNSFSIESLAAAAGDDTTAGTMIVGKVIFANPVGAGFVLEFDAPSDTHVTGQDVSGLDCFQVLRNGSPVGSCTPFVGEDYQPIFAASDVGTVSNTDAVQTGADWVLTAEGGAVLDGSNFLFLHAPVTGDFTLTGKIESFAGAATDENRGAYFIARESTAAGSRQFSAHTFPSFRTRGYNRPTTDGTITGSCGLVATPALPWVKVTRVDNLLTSYAASDSNSFGEVCPLTMGLNETLEAGLGAHSNQEGVAAIIVSFENVSLNTMGRQSFTDTGGSPGDSYTIVWDDLAGNTAVASLAVVAPDAPVVGGGTFPPAFDDPRTTAALGGRTTVPIADNAALAAAIGDAECGDTYDLADGDYTFDLTFTLACPPNNPLLILGDLADHTDVRFTNAAQFLWDTDSRGIIVVAIHCDDCDMYMAGYQNELLGSKLNFGDIHGIQVGGDPPGTTVNEVRTATNLHHNVLAWNEFGPHVNGGEHYFVHSQQTVAETAPHDIWIYRNRFFGADGTNSDRDYVEPGMVGKSWEHTENPGWYLQENHLGCVDGSPSSVDMKLGGAVFVNNFTCEKINQRFSSNGIWVNNQGAGPLMITGQNAIVVGNSAAVRLMAGETACDATSSGPGTHRAACNTKLEKNTGTVVIGYEVSASYDVPVSNTTVYSHTGPGSINCTNLHTGTTPSDVCSVAPPTSSSEYDLVPLIPITTDIVGPAAMCAEAPAAWLAARAIVCP